MKKGLPFLLVLAACGSDPPAPTPVVVATPTPAATPRPAAFDAATACGAPVLGRDDARSARCDSPMSVIGGEYSSAVIEAQHWLVANRPELFFPTGRARDTADYTDALAERVARATGLCASRNVDNDGETVDDEIRVKNGNGAGASGEWFDVVLADNTPWSPPQMNRRCHFGSGW